MKLTTFLLILLISLQCFAEDEEKLPEVPWKAIVEMEKNGSSPVWTEDVRIKLYGDYSTEDSLMIINSITKLNGITETINIGFTKQDRGNLEIYFLNDSNSQDYNYIITLTKDENSRWSYSMLQSKARLFTLAINLDSVPVKSKQNFITDEIAFALYPVFWTDSEYFDKKRNGEKVQESIFRSIEISDREKLFLEEMQELDIRLLTAVYSHDFEEKLAQAKAQFKTNLRYPQWLQANPYAYLLLPFGFLLLLLIPGFLKISKFISNKISHKTLLFNVSGIIGILILSMVVAGYFTLSKAIGFDGPYSKTFLKNLLAWGIIIFVIGLPAINILRLVEILIHKNTHRKVLKVILIFLSTGLIPFLSVLGIYLYINRDDPFRELRNYDYKLLSYVFIVCMVLAGFRALISYFFFKEKELIIENETKLSTLRELKSKAELNALHSRINPHFLYNSLNSIAGLAHENADKTEHMALSLSKLFRYSINKEKSDWTTFDEELEMVRIYLDVEKVRFGDRLDYSVEIPKELEKQQVPRFIIQPLVENAVKHGISNAVDGGEIKVIISKQSGETIISVLDSGPSFPNDLNPGFGIQSIYDKLEILYPDKFEMTFSNSPQKQVTIKLQQ